MKKMKWFMAVTIVIASIGLTACQKKDDPAVKTSSGGGASTQSVLHVKGAGQ